MKFIRTTGCMAWSYTIDGKEQVDLTSDEKQEVFNRIMPALEKEFKSGNISIFDIIELIQADSYESTDEPCESCGDYIYTETWEI